MAKLEDILASARVAGRQDRILWRDQIAQFGPRAIQPMQEWLTDPELGALAVRVLGKIADQPIHRRAVVGVLRGVDLSAVSSSVERDVAEVLARIGHRGVTGAGRPTRAPLDPWPGYAGASSLEQRFHDEMLDIFRLAGEATRQQRSDGTVIRGYWASYFLRGVRNHGGVAYAHQLLRAEGTTDGFRRLTEESRLDLTMEALVLRPEYEPLFSPHERQVAASRLARAGFQLDGER